MADISSSKLIAPHSPKSGLNVLVGAYACEPHRGSEPGVGWNMVQQIARSHRVWVVTDTQHETPITLETQRSPNPNITFIFVGIPWWPRCINKGGNDVRLADFLYYYIWQFYAWRAAILLRRRIALDICHHVTFVNDWIFSFGAFLQIPFIWGPIGTHPPIPSAGLYAFSHVIRAKLRTFIKFLARCLDPLYWLCLLRASIIVVLSPEISRQFPLYILENRRLFVSPAIGVDCIPTLIPPCTRYPGFRVFTAGRLVFEKGFHLALYAFAEAFRGDDAKTLVIVGDGPEEHALHSLCQDLGIAGQVHFLGWIPRDRFLEALGTADAFLYPSVEGGGMVVLEAMAAALPVVCLDYGGPGFFVDDACGIRVPVSTRAQVISGLSSALTRLSEDASLRASLGHSARSRVKMHFTWSSRIDSIDAWYCHALSPHKSLR